MKKINNDWKLHSIAFNHNVDDVLQQQHHAAQFIAMVGRHLIPQQPDDSNTNMEFIPGENILIGNSLPNGIRVALHLTKMKLSILDNQKKTKKIITLVGKTKQKVFEELKQSLSDWGIDVTDFKNELHYEIPTHQLDSGATFSIKNENDFIENTKYRHNAKIVLNEIATLFEKQEPIRIWPHHFDTGAFFTIARNEKGEAIQTIGIGLAIPDNMVSEPYYYLSFWSENPIDDISDIAALEVGRWMMPDWNGAVLKNSEILEYKTAQEQIEKVKLFFTQGIEILMNYLNNLNDEKT